MLIEEEKGAPELSRCALQRRIDMSSRPARPGKHYKGIAGEGAWTPEAPRFLLVPTLLALSIQRRSHGPNEVQGRPPFQIDPHLAMCRRRRRVRPKARRR